MLEVKEVAGEGAEEVLRQRAESLAREAAAGERGAQTPVLVFRLVDEWYGVEVKDLREIFQEYAITPVPSVPEHVLGVVNVRGEILSVTDPARLMGLGRVSTRPSAPAPAVVISDGTVSTALVVDAIGDILEVAQGDFEAPVSSIDRTHGDYVTASMCVDGKMLSLINTARMLEPILSGPGL